MTNELLKQRLYENIGNLALIYKFKFRYNCKILGILDDYVEIYDLVKKEKILLQISSISEVTFKKGDDNGEKWR